MQFTEKYIQSLKPKNIRYEVREKSGNGFAVRISPVLESDTDEKQKSKARKSWIFFYAFEGRKRRMTFGTYPEMSLADAKKKHRQAMSILENGKDPGQEKIQKEIEARGAATIEALINEYMEMHAKPNKRSWKEDLRMLSKDVLPVWGKRKARDIGRRDVIQLLDKIKERGAPIVANRTLACMRRMFNFAVKRAILDLSPCVMIEAPAKENRRDRYLSAEEIKIFWDKLSIAPMSELIKLALKLLLTTAQRKSEVISAEWSEVNFVESIWTIPSSKAKNGQAHRVPLSSLALEILFEIKKISGESRWMFPSERADLPIRGQSVDHALRRSMCLFSDMENFCVHDCRRTGLTHMASLRISGEILSRVANHAKRGVTELHYIKHSYDDEKRHALEVWASRLKEIILNETISNVISLKVI